MERRRVLTEQRGQDPNSYIYIEPWTIIQTNMSQQQRMGGQPMIILGEDSQRMKDRDAQSHNIEAAQAVSESVRSTLGPKGMDKMLVSSMGDVTVTNDGAPSSRRWTSTTRRPR